MNNLCEYIMKDLDCQTQHALGWQYDAIQEIGGAWALATNAPKDSVF
jgi:hypothetical protein